MLCYCICTYIDVLLIGFIEPPWVWICVVSKVAIYSEITLEYGLIVLIRNCGGPEKLRNILQLNTLK